MDKNMKKKVIIITFIIFSIFASVSVYASQTVDLEETTQVDVVQKELSSLQDYKNSYGDDSIGLVAYLLNGIRIYSIPIGLVAIAICAIYRYSVGVRKLEIKDKGFSAIIRIVTIMVICQMLPLIFVVFVEGWRN